MKSLWIVLGHLKERGGGGFLLEKKEKEDKVKIRIFLNYGELFFLDNDSLGIEEEENGPGKMSACSSGLISGNI